MRQVTSDFKILRHYHTLRRFRIQHQLQIQNRLFYEDVIIYELIKSRSKKNEWDFSLSRSFTCCNNTRHFGMFWLSCSALVVNSASIKKKKKITVDFSRFFCLKICDFSILGGFWVFFFQLIQQTKFIQENVLIIVFQFCTKFCFHQHQNREILPTNFRNIVVWKLFIFYNLFFFTCKTSQDLRFLSSNKFYY